jgi:hypothetical protein
VPPEAQTDFSEQRSEYGVGEPIVSGGKYTLFCRALSVLVTFLCTDRVDPDYDAVFFFTQMLKSYCKISCNWERAMVDLNEERAS